MVDEQKSFAILAVEPKCATVRVTKPGGGQSFGSSPLVAEAKFLPDPGEVVAAYRIVLPRLCRLVLQHLQPADHLLPTFPCLDRLARRLVAESRDRLVQGPAVMIREALVNDAALFVRWKTNGVLRVDRSRDNAIICSTVCRSTRGARTRPARTGSSSARPRAARASELTDNVTAFAVSSTFPSTMAPSSIVVPKVWVARLPFADFRRGAFSSTQFQKASLSFQRGGRSSSAARIAGGFDFETSGKWTVMNSRGSPSVFRSAARSD